MVHLKFGARTIYEISEFQNNYKEVSIIEKMKIPTLMNNLKLSVLSLPKYNSTYGSGGLDCWGEMEEDRDGEYIKLQDVLNLFSTKNS
jgi:hypothetical protein